MPNEIHPTIPVLDLDDFKNQELRKSFLTSLNTALQDVGFFALKNSGVDKSLLNEAYTAAQTFFNLPMASKRKIWNPALNGQRGWVPSESAQGESKKDWKEFLHIGKEDQKNPLQFGKNLWPDEMDLKKPMVQIYAALEKNMSELNQAFSLALEQKADFLSSYTAHAENLMRVLHYPTQPPEGTPLAAAHTDIDLYTILPFSTEEGLEVLNNDDEWVPVKVPDGCFIINAGDMLKNLSNGLFRSSVHRVVAAKSGCERYSIVFFVHGHQNADMSPLASMIEKTGGIAKFPNATEYMLLSERLAELGLASTKMLQDLANSGLSAQRQILNEL